MSELSPKNSIHPSQSVPIVGRSDLLRAIVSGHKDVAQHVADELGLEYQPNTSSDSRLAMPNSEALGGEQPKKAAVDSSCYPADIDDLQLWVVTARIPRGKLPEESEGESYYEWTNPPKEMPVHQPVSSWRQIGPRLRSGLSNLSNARRLDMKELIDRTARCELIERLPRHRKRRWGNSLQIILDSSIRLSPIRFDQQQLVKEFAKILPVYSCEVFWGTEPPHFSTICDQAEKGSEKRYRMPVPGTQVLVFGDLGCFAASQSTRQRWLNWGRQMLDQGAQLLALFPGHVSQVHPMLRSMYSIQSWQCGQCSVFAQADREELLKQLMVMTSPAIRVEPGFLRDVRKLLPVAGDSSLEIDYWNSQMLTSNHPIAATIDHRIAKLELRAAFEELASELRRKILKRLRNWRVYQQSSPEIWFEEILSLSAESQRLLDKDDRKDARAWLKQCDSDRRHGGSLDSPEVESYLSRSVVRFSESTYDDPEIGLIARRMSRELSASSKVVTGTDPREVSGGTVRDFIVQIDDRAISFRESDSERLGPSEFRIESSNGYFTVRDDYQLRENVFWKRGEKPEFVSDFGRDEFGLWFEFEVPKGLPEYQFLSAIGREVIWAEEEQNRSVYSEEIKKLLRMLSYQQREVLRMRFGLGDGYFYTLEETAQVFQRTSTQIEAIESTAINKLSRMQIELDEVDPMVFQRVCQRMRWVPAGDFMMGSSKHEEGRLSDETLHYVELSQGFWIADTPVTQELWKAVTSVNPSEFVGDQRPVEKVRWRDANDFFQRVGVFHFGIELDLPTEAQWEYACRGGTSTPFWNGDVLAIHDANFDERVGQTCDVKGFPANPFGLFDMHGNVWEWCRDWYGVYSLTTQSDPAGPGSGAHRVIRGGSWIDNAHDIRSACRTGSHPDSRYDFLGFRFICNSKVAEPNKQVALLAEYRKGGNRVHETRNAGHVYVNERPVRSPCQIDPAKRDQLEVVSDCSELTIERICKPHWAKCFGRDEYGVFADLEIQVGDPVRLKEIENSVLKHDRGLIDISVVRQRLRLIPAGSFLMGSPVDEIGRNDDEHLHPVSITNGFWMFDSPCTQHFWLAVIDGENPSAFKDLSRPVEGVSWEDAGHFCRMLSAILHLRLELPTEAQWEYAARAGTQTAFYSGNLDAVSLEQSSQLSEIAWHGAVHQDSRQLADTDFSWGTKKTHRKRPNRFGLFDMLGNVWEWCYDWRADYKLAAVVDPTGPKIGKSRVLRGGSWSDSARHVRAAYRYGDPPGIRYFNLGFRCMSSVGQATERVVADEKEPRE